METSLDVFHSAVLEALQKIYSNNSQAPSQLDSTDLGRWLEFLKGSGNSAVLKKVNRLHETFQQRANLPFMASCYSYGIGLVCFASDPNFLAAIRTSSTVAELARAMPPERFEIDCTGRAYQIGSSALIEMAEIKNSRTPKVWVQGLQQLHRNLTAVGWALTTVQRCLPKKLPPNLTTGKTSLVGHLCVPRPRSEQDESVSQCVDDWVQKVDSKILVKVIML
jgi:hypothetical protein